MLSMARRAVPAGTEAAAVTALTVNIESAVGAPQPMPVVFRVNRPFAFSLQHLPTPSSVFLGDVYGP